MVVEVVVAVLVLEQQISAIEVGFHAVDTEVALHIHATFAAIAGVAGATTIEPQATTIGAGSDRTRSWHGKHPVNIWPPRAHWTVKVVSHVVEIDYVLRARAVRGCVALEAVQQQAEAALRGICVVRGYWYGAVKAAV